MFFFEITYIADFFCDKSIVTDNGMVRKGSETYLSVYYHICIFPIRNKILISNYTHR